MTKPVARYGVDWDDDLFICYDALRTDALNVMHTGKSSDTSLVNLHWWSINTTALSGATIATQQEHTDYGVRKLHVVTGTNTGAGTYFGWSGSSDINVTNGASYTAVMWIKATVGSGTSMKLDVQDTAASTTFTISGSWQKVSVNFTGPAGGRASFKIYKNNSATNVTFDATGFMIVSGSTTPTGFNVGDASNLYDNITQDVKSCSYTIGKQNYTYNMIAEGEATLTLDNDSKRYSPEYSSSPLYGKMDTRRRFTMDIQNSSGTYVRRFTGWAVSYAPTPGVTRAREMTMKCQQGKFLLDRIQFNQTQTTTTTADAILRSIVLKGYPSAATPLQAIMNRARLNACYFVNPSDIYSIETGISTIDGTGAEEWLDAPATQVIDSLITVDQGFFFIDHAGKVVYYNRYHFLDPGYGVSSTTISVDSEIISSQYQYGANYANTVRVNYYPSTTRVDTVWINQGAIRVYGGRAKVKEIDVKFQYTEGKKVNVTEIADFGPGGTDSSLTALDGTQDVSAKVQATFEQKGAGGKLTIRNYSGRAVNCTVILRGAIVESYGGRVASVTDESGLLGGVVQNTLSSKLLPDEDAATNLANYILSITNQNVGQFASITMLNDSNAALDKILGLEIGDKVTLSETQTAHASKDYYVCGVNETWKADTVLNTTYQLSPLFRLPHIWILGTSVLGSETYLAY